MDQPSDLVTRYQTQLVFVEMPALDLLRLGCVVQQLVRHRLEIELPMLDVCRSFVAGAAQTLELVDPILADILKKGWR